MIGVFDSGVGGLTVLRDLALHFPFESFIYLGDTARLPYGTKSPETIRAYSEQVMNYLAAKNVKAIVIACNSASSQVPEDGWHNIPVYNVITPGAQAAIKETKNLKIGVLGTRATIESHTYFKALKKIDNDVQVFSESCPLLVPLAEEALIDDPITNLIVYRYVQPLVAQGIDTLILGCTHYPLLKKAIQKACGVGVTLVDSGVSVSEKMTMDFVARKITPDKSIESTDLSEHSIQWAQTIMNPVSITSIAKVDLL